MRQQEVNCNTRVASFEHSGLRLVWPIILLSLCFIAPATAGESSAAKSADPATLAASLADFNRGCALLDQFEYGQAAAAFEKTLSVFPDWTAARFNLALAQLNLEGAAAKGKANAKEQLEGCRKSLEAVLAKEPKSARANFILGIYYQHVGDAEAAAKCYEAVRAVDAKDPFVLYKYAEVLLRLGKTDEATKVLEQVIELDPGFVSAVYRLSQQYQRSGKRDRVKPLLERFSKLRAFELAGGTFVAGEAYSEGGKYYQAVGADNLPLPAIEQKTGRRVVLSPNVRKFGEASSAWKWAGGDVRIPGIAAGDLDGDGDLDLCLCGAGGQLVVYTNDGSGNFTAGSPLCDRVVSVALGDVDNDGALDVWAGREGEDWLLLNDGKGKLTRADAPKLQESSLANGTCFFDIDSDGDLDLLSTQIKSGSIPAQGDSQAAASRLWTNNRNGSWANQAESWGLISGDTPIAAVVAADFDNDRDLDLIIFPDGKRAPSGWLNDRGGAYRRLDGKTLGCEADEVISATTGDPDKDGYQDLLVCTRSGVRLYRNLGGFRFEENADFTRQFGPLKPTGGCFADIDNDGDLDLVFADAQRADGEFGPVLLVNRSPAQGFFDACAADPGNLLNGISYKANASCVVADFTGDGRCDLLLWPAGEQPMLLENATQGGHWIQFDLRGTATKDQKSRSNNSAIGARVEIKSGRILQQYVIGGSTGPTSSAPLRVHAGLGDQAKVEWLRILWPDAALQAELELSADRTATITELNRKGSSCPYLFAWTGSRYEFVCDFGGTGGLGFLLSPGKYAPPDPTEYVPLPNLKPLNGTYSFRCVTPLEEVTYFDEAKLVAVDHPAGTQIYPNEMMAVSGPAPPFEIFCVRETIDPAHAVDGSNRDVTDLLRRVDRRYVGPVAQDVRFMGVAQPHLVDLEFPAGAGKLSDHEQLVLVLNGWVEYGYSSTNYAASQAGVELKAPTISVWREGKWVPVLVQVGYPAGVNHLMTVDMTSVWKEGDSRLRIETNMDLYWDRIFLAVSRGKDVAPVRELGATHAELRHLGYPREYSPDGARPNLSDYDNIDRDVAWKLMAGDYTRFGNVRDLLTLADDRFVIMGHGDEIAMEFSAAELPPVAEGFQRSFLLKTDSYCKDMDLYTAYPDTVTPLPFHGMSGYPYGAGEQYPRTPETIKYQQEYNTRRAGP